MRSWNPMNFVFTSLSSPPRLWFLCSRLFAGLACPFFFSRHKTQAACLRVKVTNFSLARSTYVAENFFWQEIQRFTWTATFSWRKIISRRRRRRAEKYLANKFSPIHWAIIYKDEFLQQNNFAHGKECWVSETFGWETGADSWLFLFYSGNSLHFVAQAMAKFFSTQKILHAYLEHILLKMNWNRITLQ